MTNIPDNLASLPLLEESSFPGAWEWQGFLQDEAFDISDDPPQPMLDPTAFEDMLAFPNPEQYPGPPNTNMSHDGKFTEITKLAPTAPTTMVSCPFPPPPAPDRDEGKFIHSLFYC